MNVKIACPHGVVTGGIELLHQVAAELNKYDDINADIWYITALSKTDIPSDYHVYENKVVNTVKDGDFFIFPEIWAHCTNEPAFQSHKMAVYWESVDNYFPHTPRDQWFKFGAGTLHISQTEYSNRFLADVLGVPDKDIVEITDYVNDDYLDCDLTQEREPVVLYNPSKGMEYTEKVMALAPDVTFKPVTGMNREQILDLMRHSMVWIDFGNFPGKDRLPREAGACGMCLVTGKRGSAKYQKDMGIPDQYKINNANFADLQEVVDKIRDLLANYGERVKLFDSYRKRVKQEKVMFERGIKALVERLRHEI